MTGHGGNEFLKFQDNEEVSAFDIADAVEQMWEKRRYADVVAMGCGRAHPCSRYNKLLFMIDTCQANTMYSKFYSPNIIATGSSELGESSLSVCNPGSTLPNWANPWQHHNDMDIGVAVIDGFTHFILDKFEPVNKSSQMTLQDLVSRDEPFTADTAV